MFSCASTGKVKLKWYEFIFILIGTILCNCCAEFLPKFYVHISTSIMLLLATLLKGKLLYTSISFAIYGVLSQIAFSIRGFETIILKINTVNAFVLALDGYFWLILLESIFYLKENKNEIHATISK